MADRAEAFLVYKSLVESGVAISLRELSEKSEDLLGERVTQNVIYGWASEDNWNDRIKLSFDSSGELRNLKILLDIAKHDILRLENIEHFDVIDPKEFASSASAFRRLLRKVPKQLVLTIEDDITRAREILHRYAVDKRHEIPRTHWATISGVWVDLAAFLVPEVQSMKQKDTIEADSIILRGRGVG